MHAALTFSALPLFVGALLSDWAYTRTYEIQWINFAAWLIAGALVMAGLALLWAAVDILRSRAARHRRALIYLVLLLVTFGLGFVNALVHAKDGWATMPGGLMLSVIVVVLAATSSVIGLLALRRRVA